MKLYLKRYREIAKNEKGEDKDKDDVDNEDDDDDEPPEKEEEAWSTVCFVLIISFCPIMPPTLKRIKNQLFCLSS